MAFTLDGIYRAFMSGNLESFYRFQYPGLLLYASKLLGEELSFLAEDCVQDTVLTAYMRKKSFPNPLSLKSFLMTGIRNRVVDIQRQYGARTNYVISKAKENPTGGSDGEQSGLMVESEILDRLYLAIESLPEIYREIFVMSYEQGMKISEISDKLGIAEITVKKRKARLLELLRESLSDLSGENLLIALVSLGIGTPTMV